MQGAVKPNCHTLTLSVGTPGNALFASMHAAAARTASIAQRFEKDGVCFWPEPFGHRIVGVYLQIHCLFGLRLPLGAFSLRSGGDK